MENTLFINDSTPAARNEVDQDHYNGNDQQDMDEAADRVTAHQTKQPQHY
jgi:hypothetical protein